ncbi:amidohydrolase family protein, partial [Acinetobacter baumannii]
VIIAVGGEVIVRRAAKTNAATIDLHDATLLPGLHDSHVHPLFAGLEQFQCRLEPGANASEVTQVVRKCALAAQPGEWVVGGNWVA